ncbi:MAG: hypothetical protein JXB42_07825 [Deltaproteobacteria bacterium]|nr:hypothetical protein [Deltaproteobacteria bacterium]
MKEQIFLLIKLQKTDSEIEEIRVRKSDLPNEMESLDNKLKSFEHEVKKVKESLDNLNKTHKEKESELNMGMENVKKTKSKLLSVKTNKEYEATLKEIDSINSKNSHIEDEIIYILDDIENTKTNLEMKEKELADYRTIYDGKRAKIEKELNSIDYLLDEVTKSYDAIRAQIHEDLIKKYDILKVKRNRRVVVPVWKEVCDGCHMNIPPQMYNELQRSDMLMLCPNCNRIIYWENRESGEEQSYV